MSETVLKVRIGELGIVRLICQKCHGVTEVPLSYPGRIDHCGLCHQPFINLANPTINQLGDVLNALRQFSQISQLVDIEFVIPVKS